jgi:hypothetical protein
MIDMPTPPDREPPWRKRSSSERKAEQARVRERVSELIKRYQALDEEVAESKDPGPKGRMIRAARKARSAIIIAVVSAVGLAATVAIDALIKRLVHVEITDSQDPKDPEAGNTAPPSYSQPVPREQYEYDKPPPPEGFVPWTCKPTPCESTTETDDE